jgi:hypothetical protein
MHSALQSRSRSKEVISSLMSQRAGIREHGFPAALRTRWPDAAELHEMSGRIIPDAFEFHEDLSVLTLIEVVDTHPIRSDKAIKIADLELAITDLDWDLTVAVFDSMGNLLAELPGWAFGSHYIGARSLRPTTDVLPHARCAAADQSAVPVDALMRAIQRIGL